MTACTRAQTQICLNPSGRCYSDHRASGRWPAPECADRYPLPTTVCWHGKNTCRAADMPGYSISDRLLISITLLHPDVCDYHHFAKLDDATPQTTHGTPPAMKRTCGKLEEGSQDHQELDGISPAPAECKLLDFTSQIVMQRAPIVVPATKLTNKPSLTLGLQETSPVIQSTSLSPLTPVTATQVLTTRT